MPIVIVCPSCNAKLKAPDHAVGKKVKCPTCSTAISVHAPAAEPDPPRIQPIPDDYDPDEREDERPRRAAKTRPAPEEDEDDRPRRSAKSRPAHDEDEEEDDRPRRGAKRRDEPEDDVDEVVDPRHEEDDDYDDEDDSPRRKKGADPVPQGETTADERSAALIFWVLVILFNPIGPVIWWIIKKKDMPFIDYQGKQWLNFMITALGISFALGILLAVAGVLGWLIHWIAGLVLGGLVFLLLMAYSVATLVYTIIALLKAKDGVWYRIPHTVQIFK